MPELPEVETVVRSLAKRVTGEVVESAWFSGKAPTFKSEPAEIALVLEGSKVEHVHRQGKHIVFDLQKDGRLQAQWIVHLGMTGRMLVTSPDCELEKHTHIIAKFSSGRELRFIDPRRFGRTWVVSGKSVFDAGGKEPLDVGLELFAGLFHARKTAIKAALLNQRLLRGIGNIYADEALFRAGVRPRRRASSLTRPELKRLYESVQQVLNEAIAAGGSSISDYVDADGERGFFQVQHRVYGREGKPCLTCHSPIKRIIVAGRGTHYCPECQK
ncbi:MAG TPA: bifunctional DNA-formamidopyrimidine glycosylase/DNA-(apurinic or apyrimidinic site) lyase [Terriglobales bacterium]|nr:bifunctional DNA-formamidopyrimidine glycosylase/DNA-(apurinic or apyrimidinic site) lyase [Terriglobales bacterium]